ncbi:MAG: OmpA family protein [Gemmobacter sp.]
MVGAATWAAQAIEARTARAIASRLMAEGITWASVTTDGLQVHLSGLAPNEAARLRAVNLAGGIIDAGRIRDGFEVAAARAFEPPRFSVEVLRNSDEISVIGLVPAVADGEAELIADVTAVAAGLRVADMLESANYPAPEGWDAALAFGVEALRLLPRSKISVAADRVAITAISDSTEEKRRLETELARSAPPGLVLALDISAPRPVLTPFTLRLVKDRAGTRFDACAADSEVARDRILRAAVAAGVTGKGSCTIGLGVPTPRWGEATQAGIAAVAALGGGTITFSDADVSLTAAPGTDQALYDRVVGELQAALPPVFSLTATLPPPPATAVAAQGPAEFTATLSREGRVELRGRLTDDLLRAAVDSFARAHFGADRVYTATRLDDGLPDGWPVRVLAGIDALSSLQEGRLVVRADTVEVEGVTGSQEARERIAQVLSGQLGPGQDFKVDVRYDEALDPLAALPTPEQCIAGLNGIVNARKITFTPGSAEIDGAARGTLEALATLLKDCPGLTVEVAGHTDSQGSEGGNLALSQARAEAVLIALQGRRLPVEGFIAKGYGEAAPVEDNGTEAGREANRRIEFTLVGMPKVVAEKAATADLPVAADDPVAARDDGAPQATAAQAEDAARASTPVVRLVTQGAGVSSGQQATISTAGEPPVAVAGAAPTDPDLGATRGVTLDAAPKVAFEPTDDVPLRPLHRPAP